MPAAAPSDPILAFIENFWQYQTLIPLMRMFV